MSTAQLNKSEWQPYLDRVSRALAGKQAEIEVDSLQLGSQVEAEWLPLLGLGYDPKSDVVEILLEGLDHLIHRPKSLFIEQNGVGLKSMEVIDSDDTRQIVRLREPIMLPAP